MSTPVVIVISIVAAIVVCTFGAVYNIVQYVKVKNQLLGEKEVRAAAENEVAKIKYRDPMISCDYCGAKIDTRRNKVCPNCGGSYSKDSEWLERHNVDSKTMGRIQGRMLSDLKDEASVRSQEKLRRIFRRIIIFAAPVVILTCAIIGIVIYTNLNDYRKNEELNTGSLYHFSEADYKVENGGVIFDDGDVTVAITGIYTDQTQYQDAMYGTVGAVRVQLHVVNRLKRKISLSVECESVSGITTEYKGFYFFDNFKKESDTTIYETLYSVPGQKISELVITQFEISDKDRKYYRTIERPVTVTTTAETPYKPDFSDQTPLFSNDKADIYCFYMAQEPVPGYVFCIVNKTGYCMEVENEAAKTRKRNERIPFFYMLKIPAGYTFISDPEEVDDDNTRGVSCLITFPEKPELGFSTGYLKVTESGD